jgi:uncharacterized membrane protein YcaP (DUF421 family)
MEFLNHLLGLETDKLEAYQMATRAFIIFFTSLLLIRIAGIRTFGKQSAFDTLTSLMLGAIMGRAVVTNQSFFGSILATLVLMLLHRLMAWLAFRNKKIGAIIKGENLLLMRAGKKQQKNLSKSHITEEDILEALRRDVNITSLDKIKEVYLERSGDISIIKE